MDTNTKPLESEVIEIRSKPSQVEMLVLFPHVTEINKHIKDVYSKYDFFVKSL